MGIFNEHISHTSSTTGTGGMMGPFGPAGPQGIGFKLSQNGNYDMQNKKNY